MCTSCGNRQRATRKPVSCGRITRSGQSERWTFTSCPRRRGRHTALLPPACRGRVPRTAGSAASARSLLPDTETACVRTPCLSLLASLQQRRTCCERRPRAQAAPRPPPALRPSGGPGRVPWGLTCQSAGFLKTRVLPREALKITTRLHVLKSRNHDRQPVTLTCSESAARNSDGKCCGTTESGGLGLRRRYV